LEQVGRWAARLATWQVIVNAKALVASRASVSFFRVSAYAPSQFIAPADGFG
jgi:hypothetical protein